MLYTFPLFRLLLWRLSNVSTKMSGIYTNNSHVIVFLVFTFPFSSVGCFLWCLLHTSCSKQHCVMVLGSKLHKISFSSTAWVLSSTTDSTNTCNQPSRAIHLYIYLSLFWTSLLECHLHMLVLYTNITMHCIQERMLTDREEPRLTSAVHTHMRLSECHTFPFPGCPFYCYPMG